MARAVVVVVGTLLVLSALQAGNAGAALVIGVVVLFFARRATRTATGHAHVGPLSLSARHEAGHMVAARYVGGHVTSAQLYRDGGGFVQARIPDKPQSVVTFLLAGALAAGTDRGAEDDFAAVDRELSEVPIGERSRVLRDARADARRIVSRRAEEIARDAERLEQNGRL